MFNCIPYIHVREGKHDDKFYLHQISYDFFCYSSLNLTSTKYFMIFKLAKLNIIQV